MTKDFKELLSRLAEIRESTQYEQIYRPLLESLGASNVVLVHGPREFGRDFKFIRETGLLGIPQLEVCQVKNEKLGNREAVHVLKQLLQARETEITNPRTNTKELPKKVYLFSTFDLPDMPDCSKLLDEVREKSVLVTGEELAKLVFAKIPDTVRQILDPGRDLLQAVESYVRTHHEAVAFELPQGPDLDGFFLDLGIRGATKSRSSKPSNAKPLAKSEWIFKSLGIPLLKASECLARSFGRDVTCPIGGDPDSDEGERVLVSYAPFTEFADQCRELLKTEGKASLKTWADRIIAFKEFDLQLEKAGDVEQWRRIPSKTLEAITNYRIEAVIPLDLLATELDCAITADAGSGKTCFSRMTTLQALQSGRRAIFFPCLRYADESISLIEHLTNFLAELHPSSSRESIYEQIHHAEVIVLDACDESPLFGEALGSAIDELMVPEGLEFTIELSGKHEVFEEPPGLGNCIQVESGRRRNRKLRVVRRISDDGFGELIRANEGSCFADGIRELHKLYQDSFTPQVIITSRTTEPLKLKSSFIQFHLEQFTEQQVTDFFKRFLDSEKLGEVLGLFDSDPNVLRKRPNNC